MNYFVPTKLKPKDDGKDEERDDVDNQNLEKGLPAQTIIKKNGKNFKQILFN